MKKKSRSNRKRNKQTFKLIILFLAVLFIAPIVITLILYLVGLFGHPWL